MNGVNRRTNKCLFPTGPLSHSFMGTMHQTSFGCALASWMALYVVCFFLKWNIVAGLQSLSSSLSIPLAPPYPFFADAHLDPKAYWNSVPRYVSSDISKRSQEEIPVFSPLDNQFNPVGLVQNFSGADLYSPLYPSPMFAPVLDPAYYQFNQSMVNHLKNKQNKNLGRRFGELMTTGAERATRAFKTFSQFKLFNDMKPSRLLGSPSNNSNTSGQLPLNQASYYPPNPTMNSWPAVANSARFYQQPVFVRTQDAMPSASVLAPSQMMTPMSRPAPLPSVQPPLNPHDFMSSFPDFLNQYQNSLYRGQKAESAPIISQLQNAQSGESSNGVLPSGLSTTTVYHHYGNSDRNNHNTDLFAAPQTQYGFRVSPPNSFDNSMEDDQPSDQDQDNDSKSNDNNSNSASSDSDGTPFNSYDEYAESSTPSDNSQQDQFNLNQLNRLNQLGLPNRNRANNQGFSNRPLSDTNAGQPTRSRPLNDSPDDPDNWYNTFFGPNAPQMNKIRNYPHAYAPLSVNMPSPSMLGASASTSTPLSMSPNKFMSSLMGGSFYQDIPLPTRQVPFMSYAPRPVAYGMMPYSAMYNYRPSATMMAADSSIRPVTMSSFMAPNNRFMMPTRPYTPHPYAYPSVPYVQPSTPYSMNQLSPAMVPQYRYPMNSYPPMMSAASTMYPRMTYAPMPLGMGSSMYPMMVQPPPMMRYRYAPDLTSTRRMINITKRADVLEPEAKQNTTTTSTTQRTVQQTLDVPNVNNSRKHGPGDKLNMASLYNAYSLFPDKHHQPSSEQGKSDFYYISKSEETSATALAKPHESSKITLSNSARHIGKRKLELKATNDQHHRDFSNGSAFPVLFSHASPVLPALFDDNWIPLKKTE